MKAKTLSCLCPRASPAHSDHQHRESLQGRHGQLIAPVDSSSEEAALTFQIAHVAAVQDTSVSKDLYRIIGEDTYAYCSV